MREASWGVVKGSVELALADLVHFRAVHADDVEERLAIDIEAGAGASALGQAAVGILRLLAKRGGGDERRGSFRPGPRIADKPGRT